jgi:hypothetical protein
MNIFFKKNTRQRLMANQQQVVTTETRKEVSHIDFWKTTADRFSYKMNPSNSKGYRIGNLTYTDPCVFIQDQKCLVTQAPWLRTTSGYIERDSDFGPQSFIQLSMYPVSEASENNTNLTNQFQEFVEKTVDQTVFNIVKQNWNEWVGAPLPDDDSLKDCQTSIIQPERDGYPACYKLNMKDMMNKGKYKGTLFMQTFNNDTKKVSNDYKLSTDIHEIKNHARTRLELSVKSFYLSIKEDANDSTKQVVRFGANWSVRKILFYNVSDSTTNEEISKAFTFGDLETTESFVPNPNIVPKGGLKLEILQTGKRGRSGEEDLVKEDTSKQIRIL